MSHFDHCTNQCELEVQRIIHLKNIANQLAYAFIDTKKVTKLHTSAINALTRIDDPKGQLANESKIHMKHGRLIDSKDITSRKRRKQRKIDAPKKVNIKQKVPVETYGEQKAPTKTYG